MLNKLTCLRCEYTWVPRKEEVKICPNPACHSPYWNRPYPQKIGREGERLVHEALSGSVWLNKDKESKDAYDVLWNGIEIDVKTANHTSLKEDSFTFITFTNDSKKIFIYVGLVKEGEPYFWILQNRSNYDPYTRKLSIRDAISANQLPQAIRDYMKKSDIDDFIKNGEQK